MEARFTELQQRIEDRSAIVGVIGLGYVGLPVAIAFAEAGFKVLGVDIDPEKVEALEAGRSFLRDVSDEQLAPLRKSKQLRASTSFGK